MELVSYNAWYNKTSSNQWSYVSTSVQGLASNKLWWNRPEFLNALDN